MTGPSRGERADGRSQGRKSGGRRPTAVGRPVKDLGPVGGPPRGGLRVFEDAETARIFEAIEAAAVKAEGAVEPFVRAAALPMVRGRAAVGVRFLDAVLQSRFLKSGALTDRHAFETRLLARTWADAGGDAHLDEHMAFVVANHLQTEFKGQLHATVFAWHERTQPK